MKIFTDDMKIANEEWKDIDETYKISNFGRVIFFRNKKWYLSSIKDNQVSIHAKQIQVCALVLKIFKNIELTNKEYIKHLDGNEENNYIENLIVDTKSNKYKQFAKEGKFDNFIHSTIKDKYNCCFTEKDFQTEKYDFLFIKNQKMCDKFMLKYNFICKFKNGLLISNKYAIYNESVYDIVRLNENDGHKYAKIYLKQCGLVIRFYDKQTRNTILNNYINIPKGNRVPVIKFTEYFCITKYIHKGFLDNFSIIKFLFVMYLLLYKNKLIFDLQQDNIIIDKKLNIYVVDMEAKNVFTKNELMRFYIMSYFFYWLNVIDNRMDKEFFDKLYQYDLKH